VSEVSKALQMQCAIEGSWLYEAQAEEVKWVEKGGDALTLRLHFDATDLNCNLIAT
jgi:hypothetical protein